MAHTKDSKFHIAMFPWFAFGHMTPFLHLSNELARRGHKISFLLPNKVQIQWEATNLHPNLITFHPLAVPHVEGWWGKWLEGFEAGSVVFCAFGSQLILENNQFQELVLGFELTGLPFFVALKPPAGATTVEEALPEGFIERVGGRGVVYGGWVQQPQILGHQSVGCFVNHCGFGTMWESLMSNTQIVLVPHLSDQILNTRLMVEELKVAVEVERDENGWVSKESLCKAINSVMDEDSEVCGLVRKNHVKWKEILASKGFMSSYVDRFIQQLHELQV